MPRHTFSLPDEAARKVMLASEDLGVRFPDSGQNREFLTGFIQATHQATGRLVGVPSIQRLLRTYAPNRRPSTATILNIKKEVEATLRSSPPVVVTGEAQLPTRMAAPAARQESEVDVTALRLLELELSEQRQRRLQVESENARLVTALQAATEQLAQAQGQAQAHAQTAESMTVRIEQLTAMANRALEVEVGARSFALQAIEAARAESRTWRERYEGVQALRSQEQALLESYRQQVHRGRS